MLSRERDLIAVLFWAGPGLVSLVCAAPRHLRECINSTSATGWSAYRAQVSLEPVRDHPDCS